MKVESYERSTGMGATHYTAVAKSGKWIRVSDLPNARSHGRQYGAYHYSAEVPNDTLTAEFYRSNSGRERVSFSDGRKFASFEDAKHALTWESDNPLGAFTVEELKAELFRRN